MKRLSLPAAPNIRWRREALLATAAVALALGCASPVLAGAPNVEGRGSDAAGRGIIVNGGVKPYSNSADATTTAELFTPGQGLRVLTGTPQAWQKADDRERRYWYPRVLQTANNKIFVLAGKIMYRIGYDGNGSLSDVQPFHRPNSGGTAMWRSIRRPISSARTAI